VLARNGEREIMPDGRLKKNKSNESTRMEQQRGSGKKVNVVKRGLKVLID
jgi:hypothetical protein